MITAKEIMKGLHPNIDFDGKDNYLAPFHQSDIKFWLVCKDGLMGYSTEESCKKAAEYYGVEYHRYTGEFGYFKKGAWIKV